MLDERTAQIVIDWDDDLDETLKVFNEVMNKCYKRCFNNGKPLAALSLHCISEFITKLKARPTLR